MQQLRKNSNPFRINTLNNAAEKMTNYIMVNDTTCGLKMANKVLSEAVRFEDSLIPFIEEIISIKGGEELSEVGKNKIINQRIDAITSLVASMDKTAKLKLGKKKAKAIIVKKVKKTLKSNRPKDETLAYIQAKEIRQYLQQQREEKKKDHEDYLKAEKKAGRLVPDQMANFHDPIEALYLHSCKHYDSSIDNLYRAITDVPYPIEVLPVEIIKKGKRLLAHAIAPDEIKSLQEIKTRQTLTKIIMDAVANTINHPEEAMLESPPRVQLSDQEITEQEKLGKEVDVAPKQAFQGLKEAIAEIMAE